MTLIEEPRQAETELPDADALIEEARQRQRKRRLFIGSIVLIVAVASGIWAASGGGSATKPPSTSKKPGHTKTPASTPGSAKKAVTSGAVTAVGPWVLGIAFPSASHGFASVLRCGSVHCFVGIEATADGGVTWHRIANLLRPLNPQTPALENGPTNETTNDLWFANDQDGMLFAKSKLVLVTDDAGARWSPVRIPGVVIQVLSVDREFVLVADDCQPPNNGYPECGQRELVTVPFGSGSVASTRRLPSCLERYTESDVVSTDGTLIAEGCHALFFSKNGGATWEQRRLAFACTPSLIAADRPSDIWAVCTFMMGAGQQLKWIYRSLNSGATWKLASRSFLGRKGTSIGKVSTTGYAFMLAATSPQHAVLLSQFSGAFATFDGGRVWVMMANAGSLSFGPGAGGIACVGSQYCWAAAGPFIVRTTNGGRSWTTAKSLIGRP